jgi:hypothetical protein
MQIRREIARQSTGETDPLGSRHRGPSPQPRRQLARATVAFALAPAMAMAVASGRAGADDGELPPQPAPALRYTGDLDGAYLYLGPVGGAMQVDSAWNATLGAHVTWLRVRERRPLAAIGASVGAARYSQRDGGVVRAELVAGTRRLAGLLVGASAGPVVELAALHHPRLGATGSAWLFSGVAPFVRVGTISGTGSFVEIGVAIAFPCWRW